MLNAEQSHAFTPQARLELGSTIRSEAERNTEPGDPRTNENTGDRIRCDVHKKCSFRPADESVGAAKDVPVAVGVRQRANDVDVDVVKF